MENAFQDIMVNDIRVFTIQKKKEKVAPLYPTERYYQKKFYFLTVHLTFLDLSPNQNTGNCKPTVKRHSN